MRQRELRQSHAGSNDQNPRDEPGGCQGEGDERAAEEVERSLAQADETFQESVRFAKSSSATEDRSLVGSERSRDQDSGAREEVMVKTAYEAHASVTSIIDTILPNVLQYVGICQQQWWLSLCKVKTLAEFTVSRGSQMCRIRQLWKVASLDRSQRYEHLPSSALAYKSSAVRGEGVLLSGWCIMCLYSMSAFSFSSG